MQGSEEGSWGERTAPAQWRHDLRKWMEGPETELVLSVAQLCRKGMEGFALHFPYMAGMQPSQCLVAGELTLSLSN